MKQMLSSTWAYKKDGERHLQEHVVTGRGGMALNWKWLGLYHILGRNSSL